MARSTCLILSLLAALAGGWLLSQARAGERGVRYALLVGCSRYDKAEFHQLPYTGSDVAQFRQALLQTGFAASHVWVMHDDRPDTHDRPTRKAILDKLALVLDGMSPEDTLVVALSGHGLQFKGEPVSYFVPLDGKASDKKTLIALSGKGGLYEQIKACKARRKLLIVNACRNDPAVSLAFAAHQVPLADEDRAGEVPEGIAAIYSCRAGQKSYYDPERKLSLFFDHVVRAWRGEYSGGAAVTLEQFFRQVTEKTKADAINSFNRGQVPLVMREFQGEWVITPAGVGLVAEMKFVAIPRGTFWMGGGLSVPPQKQVMLDRDFELAAYCVTQGQWQQVMGDNPSHFSRQGPGKDQVANIADEDLARFPVERVSWENAQAFIKKVNAREAGKGWTYRLPREAEWEYACRNAAKTKEECGFDFYLQTGTNDLSSTQANFNGKFPGGNGRAGPWLGRTTKVWSYAPNKLGLYDMHGNVWQWCEDLYHDKGAGRVIRGSGWVGVGLDCRAAFRLSRAPAGRDSYLGFRLARVRVGG